MKTGTGLKCFIGLSVFLFNACVYKAGNRQTDLNISIPVSINTFYVDDYLRQRWMKTTYLAPLNSELLNYPKDFVPLTDSLNHLKYVIELRVSGDSLHNDGWGLILSSIYNYEKKIWITDKDSLQNNELSKFESFLRDNVLIKTVDYYRGKVSDSILFIGGSNEIKIKEFK